MREMMEEYAAIAAGGLAVAMFLGITFAFALGNTGLCQLVSNFAQGIC